MDLKRRAFSYRDEAGFDLPLNQPGDFDFSAAFIGSGGAISSSGGGAGTESSGNAAGDGSTFGAEEWDAPDEQPVVQPTSLVLQGYPPKPIRQPHGFVTPQPQPPRELNQPKQLLQPDPHDVPQDVPQAAPQPNPSFNPWPRPHPPPQFTPAAQQPYGVAPYMPIGVGVPPKPHPHPPCA